MMVFIKLLGVCVIVEVRSYKVRTMELGRNNIYDIVPHIYLYNGLDGYKIKKKFFLLPGINNIFLNLNKVETGDHEIIMNIE
jgi:hypothetical protein